MVFQLSIDFRCLRRADNSRQAERKMGIIQGAVSLDLNTVAGVAECDNNTGQVLPKRLTAGDNDERRFVSEFCGAQVLDPGHKLARRHHFAPGRVVGVTPRALKVAPCKPDKHRRGAGKRTLPLNGVKYVVKVDVSVRMAKTAFNWLFVHAFV